MKKIILVSSLLYSLTATSAPLNCSSSVVVNSFQKPNLKLSGERMIGSGSTTTPTALAQLAITDGDLFNPELYVMSFYGGNSHVTKQVPLNVLTGGYSSSTNSFMNPEGIE